MGRILGSLRPTTCLYDSCSSWLLESTGRGLVLLSHGYWAYLRAFDTGVFPCSKPSSSSWMPSNSSTFQKLQLVEFHGQNTDWIGSSWGHKWETRWDFYYTRFKFVGEDRIVGYKFWVINKLGIIFLQPCSIYTVSQFASGEITCSDLNFKPICSLTLANLKDYLFPYECTQHVTYLQRLCFWHVHHLRLDRNT